MIDLSARNDQLVEQDVALRIRFASVSVQIFDPSMKIVVEGVRQR